MSGMLLSLGHGYTADALTLRLGSGWQVIGTTRASERAEALRAAGVAPRIWPEADLATDIAAATHILSSAGPTDAGDPILAAVADALAEARPSWVGYLSATSVYGDHAGGWVDEDTPLAPTTEMGARRAAAEAEWQAASRRGGWPLAIFRLAGIYGPGRGPLARVRGGTAKRIVKPGHMFSRIHVDDIANVLAASMARPESAAPGGTVYNVCDDEPAPADEVLAHAAELLGAPPPPQVAFEDAAMSPMARAFYADNKRVRNDRIKGALGVRLLYPSYREGLAAQLEAERAG